MNPFEKLKILRSELGLSQGDFADKLGIHQRDLSKLERGQKKFLPTNVITQIMRMGFDVNTLFDDEIPLQKLIQEEFSAEESALKYSKKEKFSSETSIENPLFIDLIEQVDENRQLGKITTVDDLMSFIKKYAQTPKAMSSEIRFLRLESTVAKLLFDMTEVQEGLKLKKKQS